MRLLALCSILVFSLGLSACGHHGKKACCGDKAACSGEHKEKCKDGHGCTEGECPMKK